MGPHQNPELYDIATRSTEPAVSDEFRRLNIVTPVLRELSALFDERENTPRAVIEPILFARLFALSMVQRSRMGLTGFSPLQAFDDGGTVEAKAAPHHDQYYSDEHKNTFWARAINFQLPYQDVSDEIRIFGLNVYIPGPNDDEIENAGYSSSATGTGLVITDRRGRVMSKNQSPIAGETVIFAVHNKTTSDAKFYTVGLIDPQEADHTLGQYAVDYSSSTEATVWLPDKQRMKVMQLQGSLQLQAVDEFQHAIDRLKGVDCPDDILSPEEQMAARAAGMGIHLS